MKVKNSTSVISEAVGSAMEFCGNSIAEKENFLTTAWLISYVARWFKIMSCRSLKLALSKKNQEKYKEVVGFLEEFLDLIQTIKVGKKGLWKPWQKGLLISTISASREANCVSCHLGVEWGLWWWQG